MSENCVSPIRRKAIIWTISEKLLTGSSGTNLREILIEIHIIFSYKKMHPLMDNSGHVVSDLNVLIPWIVLDKGMGGHYMKCVL